MSNALVLERVEAGMVLDLGAHTFTRDEIIRFASKFDPQPFHLDDEAARQSHFGALCASGWHTLSVWMRYNIENGPGEYRRLTGHAPQLGPSPGLRNIRWTAPVFAGDTVAFRTTIMGKRTTPGRSGYAMIRSHSEGFKSDGTRAFTMEGAAMLRPQD